jgi:hypothetical protein
MHFVFELTKIEKVNSPLEKIRGKIIFLHLFLLSIESSEGEINMRDRRQLGLAILTFI